MTSKTHTTAVVIIPPADLWEPIQAIRRQYDRHARRWMPHITLLYPFRLREQLAASAQELAETCCEIAPFEIRLSSFPHFVHGRGSHTIWLAPEPVELIRQLHKSLVSTFPDCDDMAGHRGGFTPHLSVAQIKGRERMRALTDAWAEEWQPILFDLHEIALIERGDHPPDDVFRVFKTVSLGKSPE
ncbi:MAG: 2'-5' RNA ligase family protein [bacterium]